MDIRLINHKIIIRNFVITFMILIGWSCFKLSNAMGGEADLKMRRDSGIIGDKKTIYGEKQYYDDSTGITHHVHRKGTFVTPKVVGDVASFGLDGNLGYTFRLACRDWRYDIRAYWSSPNITEERVGFSVSLESPNKKTLIIIKEIDIPTSTLLSSSSIQEQFNISQAKDYIEDPFLGDDRMLAAQQAIKWLLATEKVDYKIRGESIKFASEHIDNKVFARAEVDITEKGSVIKKCSIWALNYRGYRLKNEEDVRRMETTIFQVISDESDYSNAVNKMLEILETFNFSVGRNVYSDFK